MTGAICESYTVHEGDLVRSCGLRKQATIEVASSLPSGTLLGCSFSAELGKLLASHYCKHYVLAGTVHGILVER